MEIISSVKGGKLKMRKKQRTVVAAKKKWKILINFLSTMEKPIL